MSGYDSNSPMSRKDYLRAGKTKKKNGSTLMKACARYLKENGPSTLEAIFFNATLMNGKPVRTRYGTKGTVMNVMKMRSDFYKAGSEFPEKRASNILWMIKEDSELL